MRNAAAVLVFLGGFIMMVLEIIGARFLPKYFGSSFHVWVSQIGVVLIALGAFLISYSEEQAKSPHGTGASQVRSTPLGTE